MNLTPHKLQAILMAILSILALSQTTPVLAAGTSSAKAQATATIASSCTINAQNLAFGNLVLPLSAQNASTSMNLLCSNNASYTVNLAYGGIYGQGNSASGDYWSHTSNIFTTCNGGPVINVWTEYNAAGTALKTAQVCPGPSQNATTAQVEAALNATYTNGTFTANSTAYAYGKMTGVASGDQIGYSIQVPNTPGKVWNAGVNAYTTTGNGVSQSIPVVGTLIPAQSSSNYPTPDSYLDTVTATVTF
jgi:spore coat protein U-like protein